MERNDFAYRFPKFYHLLEEMGFDNGMSMKDVFKFSIGRPVEEQAELLEGEEFELMAAGEESERKALVDRKGLHLLDSTLESAFDGHLAQFIWE